MAGLEDGLEKITGRASPTLQTNSRSSRMQRGEDRLISSGDCSRRRWTKSQSPLRQLLSTASRSPSPSPTNIRRGGGGGGGGSGEDCLMGLNQVEGHGSDRGTAGDGSTGKPSIASLESVGKAGTQHDRVAAAAAESHRTTLPDAVGSTPIFPTTQQEGEQQERQHLLQQRVCLKSVLHPVTYDECHTPSEEEGQAGGGSSGSKNCDDSRGDVHPSSRKVTSTSAAAAGSSSSIVSADDGVLAASAGGSSSSSGSASKCGS